VDSDSSPVDCVTIMCRAVDVFYVCMYCVNPAFSAAASQ